MPETNENESSGRGRGHTQVPTKGRQVYVRIPELHDSQGKQWDGPATVIHVHGEMDYEGKDGEKLRACLISASVHTPDGGLRYCTSIPPITPDQDPGKHGWFWPPRT